MADKCSFYKRNSQEGDTIVCSVHGDVALVKYSDYPTSREYIAAIAYTAKEHLKKYA